MRHRRGGLAALIALIFVPFIFLPKPNKIPKVNDVEEIIEVQCPPEYDKDYECFLLLEHKTSGN